MLYREIIAVCSQIPTKHINILCGQNVELVNVKLVVDVVTTGTYSNQYPYNGSRAVLCGMTDMKKLIVTFRTFAPKNGRTSRRNFLLFLCR